MDALPAVNRPPLCTPSPILGSGSLSPLPVDRFPRFRSIAFPASGKGVPPPLRKAGAWFESRRKHRCFPLWQRRPAQPAADVRVESRRPAAAHRHTVLTVTMHTRLDAHKGQRGHFGSAGCPQLHTLTPAAGNRRPKRHTITTPAPDGRPMSATAAPQRAPATTGTPPGASQPGKRGKPESDQAKPRRCLAPTP
jgi:hypothetical protein